MAVTYDTLGSDVLATLLRVVIVSTVVIPEGQKTRQTHLRLCSQVIMKIHKVCTGLVHLDYDAELYLFPHFTTETQANAGL